MTSVLCIILFIPLCQGESRDLPFKVWANERRAGPVLLIHVFLCESSGFYLAAGLPYLAPVDHLYIDFIYDTETHVKPLCAKLRGHKPVFAFFH